MKTRYLKTAFLLILCTLFSCDNDDGNAANETMCNFQGLSYLDSTNSEEILVSDTDIKTQFFPNAANGPFGEPGFEIVSNTANTSFFFTTNAIVLNQTGIGRFILNNGAEQLATVTCQRAGNMVGDEVRLDVTVGPIEMEFCVSIDEVL